MIEEPKTQKEPIAFFTDEGIDVSKHIEKGVTKKFTNHNEALKYAAYKRSYVYILYCTRTHKRNVSPEFYGFAVPK